MEKDKRVENLPKWAQRYVSYLESVVQDQREALEKVSGERPDAIAFRGYGGQPILWRGESIVFGDADKSLSNTFSVHVDNTGALCIAGGRPVGIRPEAANALRVELVER